jgi:hypothetical protein
MEHVKRNAGHWFAGWCCRGMGLADDQQFGAGEQGE